MDNLSCMVLGFSKFGRQNLQKIVNFLKQNKELSKKVENFQILYMSDEFSKMIGELREMVVLVEEPRWFSGRCPW